MRQERKRILVVEDEEYVRGLLRLTIERAGYQVIEAPDAEEALTLLVEERPNLILLDIQLPGMNGFELCTRLKTDPMRRQIPVLMLTALSEEAEREQGLKAGADGYVVKPFGPFALLNRIRSVLGDEPTA